MSMIYDKGKYRYFYDSDQLKIKNSHNSLPKNIKKVNNNNINNNIKHPRLYKEYMGSSPPKNVNITNNKKSSFLNTFQNNNNSAYEPTNINIKKNIPPKKLKYNRSFEANFNTNLIASNNFDLNNEDLYFAMNNNKLKKLNGNSTILNDKPKTKNKNKHNNKSMTKTINNNSNNNTHYYMSQNNNNINNKKGNFEQNQNIIIKKLDDKFKSLENNIIDKKYENDIDHDEMIITTQKKNVINNSNNNNINNTFICTNIKSKANSIKNKSKENYLSNIIGFNEYNTGDNDLIKSNSNSSNNLISNNKKNNDNNSNIDSFMDMNERYNIKDYDENYLVNSSFENNRSDFGIMYTDKYEKSVIDDMLTLEIKLMIEKILELQNSYHKELNNIISQYNYNKQLYHFVTDKLKSYYKKLYILKKVSEIKNIKAKSYNFINVYQNKNKKDVTSSNKSEFQLWRNMLNKQSNSEDKTKLKLLFKIIVFDNFNKISGKLDSIELKIIDKLMKKYNYKLNNKNNSNKSIKYSNNIYNNEINSSERNNNKALQSNKIFQISSMYPQYKNIIHQNKLNHNIINSNNFIGSSVVKKKHKKTSSCCQPKGIKYPYFKNIK